MATTDLDAVEADIDPTLTPPPRMTEDEFVDWAFANEAWAEWEGGEVVLMNAANPDHGALFSFMYRLIGDFAEAHDLGDVLPEPVVIRLPRQRRRRSPDLFYFSAARRSQLTRRHFEGPPDLIVEIISPDSRHRDTVVKFAEYAAAGVPEYWLPDPEMGTFSAFALGADGRYADIPEVDGAVHSAVLPGLYFRPEWVWQLRFPKVAPLLQLMAAERAKRIADRP